MLQEKIKQYETWSLIAAAIAIAAWIAWFNLPSFEYRPGVFALGIIATFAYGGLGLAKTHMEEGFSIGKATAAQPLQNELQDYKRKFDQLVSLEASLQVQYLGVIRERDAVIEERDKLVIQVEEMRRKGLGGPSTNEKDAIKRAETLKGELTAARSENVEVQNLLGKLGAKVAQLEEQKNESDIRHNKEISSLKNKLKSEIADLIGKLDNEKRRTSKEIERRIRELSHEKIVDLIAKRISLMSIGDLSGEGQSAMITLQAQIEDTFSRNGLVDVNRLMECDENIFRINEYETIIDQYMSKIRATREKPDLDEEDREEKIMTWRRLLDREISMMEGAV